MSHRCLIGSLDYRSLLTTGTGRRDYYLGPAQKQANPNLWSKINYYSYRRVRTYSEHHLDTAGSSDTNA
eukprot:scaffold753_cov34-Attheya_sp.AAC.1